MSLFSYSSSRHFNSEKSKRWYFGAEGTGVAYRSISNLSKVLWKRINRPSLVMAEPIYSLFIPESESNSLKESGLIGHESSLSNDAINTK
jgi:hypothetical protein